MTEPRDTPPSGGENLPLTPSELAELSEALVSAYRPKELDPVRHEELLESVLSDPLRPASDDELRESERFRRAIEGRATHPDLALARALSEMYAPEPVHGAVEELNERALDRALRHIPRSRGRRSATVLYVSFGLATSLAAAALVLLFVLPERTSGMYQLKGRPATPSAGLPDLNQSRSSAPLFNDKFERAETTDRIDRIASVRARELRANRFRQWGVR